MPEGIDGEQSRNDYPILVAYRIRSSRLMVRLTAWRSRTSRHGLPTFRMLNWPNMMPQPPGSVIVQGV